jgi:hypothetical protein
MHAVSPIYCAEQVREALVQRRSCSVRNSRRAFMADHTKPTQIHVPADLGDVLKAFTKEVIRRQPADLVQFSAE